MKQVLSLGHILIHVNNDGTEFTDKQWEHPLTIRHNAEEYEVYLHYNKARHEYKIETAQCYSVEIKEFTDTEIELVLLIMGHVRNTLDRPYVEKFCREYSILTTDISFSFRIVDDTTYTTQNDYSRILPGGSYITPNTIYATNRRIIMRDPYMLGIKENIIDIPYDVITSVKVEKGLLSSTIRFEAPALVGSRRLGMIHGIISGETDNEGVFQAIPKRKAEDLVQVIRSGMYSYGSEIHTPPNQQPASSTSIADELAKLAKLKGEGILTAEEFE